MKIIILGTVLTVMMGAQTAIAEPPSGGFSPPEFSDIDSDGNTKLSLEEVETFFETNFSRGGNPPSRDVGESRKPPSGGSERPPEPPSPQKIFAQWDTDSDGQVTEEEFDSKQRHGPAPE